MSLAAKIAITAKHSPAHHTTPHYTTTHYTTEVSQLPKSRPQHCPTRARRHIGLGPARTLVPPSGGAAGRPQGSLEPERVTTLCHRCTTHYTQRAFRHTFLPSCITRMQDHPGHYHLPTAPSAHHTTPHPLCAAHRDGVAVADDHHSRTAKSHSWPCGCNACGPTRVLSHVRKHCQAGPIHGTAPGIPTSGEPFLSRCRTIGTACSTVRSGV